MGKTLLLIGVVFIITGGIFYLLGRAGFSFGRFPGNISMQMGNATCVFALGASIILSILLTLILNIVARFLNR